MAQFIILLVLAVVDYIAGLIRAIIEKNLSSSVGYKGILKKILMFCVVAVAYLFDQTAETNILSVVTLFYATNEGISIIENACSCGVPLPLKLKEALEVLHNKGEKSND